MRVPLRLGARSVTTVFDLLGSAENDLTYALGWALANAVGFAKDLMADIFSGDVGDVTAVNLQRFGPDGGFTDVEVVAERGHLIIEAKRNWQVPTHVQLERYRNRLEGIPAVLLSLSAASRQWALRGNRLPPALGDVGVDHRSWADLARLAERRASQTAGASRSLLRDLALYFQGVSRMQNVSSNWAYCVVLAAGDMPGSRATWKDVPLVHRHYTHPYRKPWPRTPPNYMAFRWGGRVRQFNHVENATVVDDLSEALPDLFDPGAITGPHAVYQLGPTIELPQPLRNGKIYASARVWVMTDLLFTAADLKQATVLSQNRRRAAGEAAEPE